MADKKHDDRVTEIAGGQGADEAPQVFKVGQMGSVHSWRRDFLKNALAGAAAGVSAATMGGCLDQHYVSQCEASFLGSGYAKAVGFTPDGKLLVSSGYGAKLWSLPDGALLKRLNDSSIGGATAAISPDGTRLASANGEIWSLHDGALVNTLPRPPGSLWEQVTFTPDGKTLASAGDDTTVALWSLPDGTLLKSLKGHSDAVDTVAISPDGTLLASGSADTTINLWSLPAGVLQSTLWDPNCPITATVACSPSGGGRANCTCDTVCTCNTVCTCDSEGGSYYYPA